MPITLTREEIARRGREIYDSDIRPRVESDNTGRFLVVDVLSGAFEIADTDRLASDQLKARRPDAVVYGVRIGHQTAYRIGGRSRIIPQ
jgi:hypothetical protein